LALLQIGNDANPLVKILQFGQLFLQIFDLGCEKMNFRFLLLSLLPQLTQFEGSFSDLNIVTEEENGAEETEG
jgi:hypothetical protein